MTDEPKTPEDLDDLYLWSTLPKEDVGELYPGYIRGRVKTLIERIARAEAALKQQAAQYLQLQGDKAAHKEREREARQLEDARMAVMAAEFPKKDVCAFFVTGGRSYRYVADDRDDLAGFITKRMADRKQHADCLVIKNGAVVDLWEAKKEQAALALTGEKQ